MALVQINRHYYYYASERVNGVPRRRYIVAGEHAREVALEVAWEREERDRKTRARRRRHARQAERERQVWEALDGPCRTIENLTRIYLEARGYHRDGRRWWRKRRMPASKTAKAQRKRTKAAPPLPVIPASKPTGTPAQRAELHRQGKAAVDELIDRSIAGDQAALDRLLGYLDTLPELTVMDAAEWAAQKIAVASAGPKDLLAPALGLRKFRKLRDELAPPGGTVLERLLASRVALCYMAVNKYEEIQAEQPRIDAAHRRFLSAVRTLALIRRVEPTPVQVNVSQNVHVATAAIASVPSPALPAGIDATALTDSRLPAPGLDREV